MNIRRSGIAAVLISWSVCLSSAADRPDPPSTIEPQSSATEKSVEAYDLAVIRVAKVNGSAADGAGFSEVLTNVVVPAGKTMFFDSALDYSSVNTVAVTVLCTICTSATTSMGSLGLVLQARWTVPDAASYVTAENKAATAFPYADSGGVVFNVFGPRFRLALQNKGTQPIALQQVTIFRRSQ